MNECLIQGVLDGSSKILGRLFLNCNYAFELFNLALFKEMCQFGAKIFGENLPSGGVLVQAGYRPS